MINWLKLIFIKVNFIFIIEENFIEMEIENLNSGFTSPQKEIEGGDEMIKVRVKITCPNSTCSFKKSFKNQFHRSDIELLSVSLKCFDWMCCERCGELLDLDLEFQI
jgi:hypothetical protein